MSVFVRALRVACFGVCNGTGRLSTAVIGFIAPVADAITHIKFNGFIFLDDITGFISPVYSQRHISRGHIVIGNFSDYIPAEEKRIEAVGQLGSQEVRVAFIKTGALCD